MGAPTRGPQNRPPSGSPLAPEARSRGDRQPRGDGPVGFWLTGKKVLEPVDHPGTARGPAKVSVRDGLRGYGGPDHEDRNASVVEDGVRYTAQEETGRSRSPPRAHHDQVGVLRVSKL